MSTPPRILTTTVGSYPVPDWLAVPRAGPSPACGALLDATRVVFNLQRQAGIDLPTDGELYRFDVNHPDTNGMIDYFVHPARGTACGARSAGATRSRSARSPSCAFAANRRRWPSRVRDHPAVAGHAESARRLRPRRERGGRAVQVYAHQPLHARAHVARRPLSRFPQTYARHRRRPRPARGIGELACACVQVDEANIPGNPEDAPLAAEAINRVLDAVKVGKAVHFCFGNYGGQTIQKGAWTTLIRFLNSLHADHLVLELAHRPASDLDALKELDARLGVGLGVVDIKVNRVETPEEIARAIERAEKTLGIGRVR